MNRYEWSDLVLSSAGPASPTVRLVLVALLKFVNDRKGYAWPGVEKIAERSGHSVRTVQRALKEAEDAGWLRRDAQPGRVTLYFPAAPGQTIDLTPVNLSPLPPSGAASTPVNVSPAPVTLAPELFKEPRKEHERPGGPPACPFCSAPLERIKPRRKDVPDFYGCTRFRETRCRGKLQLEEVHGTTVPNVPAPEVQAAEAAERRAKIRQALAEEEAGEPSPLADVRPGSFATKAPARGGLASVGDARAMAGRLLQGKLATG